MRFSVFPAFAIVSSIVNAASLPKIPKLDIDIVPHLIRECAKLEPLIKMYNDIQENSFSDHDPKKGNRCRSSSSSSSTSSKLQSTGFDDHDGSVSEDSETNLEEYDFIEYSKILRTDEISDGFHLVDYDLKNDSSHNEADNIKFCEADRTTQKQQIITKNVQDSQKIKAEMDETVEIIKQLLLINSPAKLSFNQICNLCYEIEKRHHKWYRKVLKTRSKLAKNKLSPEDAERIILRAQKSFKKSVKSITRRLSKNL